MTGAVLDRPGTLFSGADRGANADPRRDGLEDLLTATLHEARANGAADCPLCHARMTPTRADVHARDEHAAECGRCGTRLS